LAAFYYPGVILFHGFWCIFGIKRVALDSYRNIYIGFGFFVVMSFWRRRVLLESIVYKMFRRKELSDVERELVEEVVEVRDYGRKLR